MNKIEQATVDTMGDITIKLNELIDLLDNQNYPGIFKHRKNLKEAKLAIFNVIFEYVAMD